jgi:3-carboxy-cis,cis-muconate cycloisomerase
VTPFQAIFVPDELAGTLSDRAWLAALLEAERALAAAHGGAGTAPAESVAAIEAACDASAFDADELARAGRAGGNPVIPLVHALRERVGDAHAEYVHRGATSQDILDSAAMLVARAARGAIDADLDGLAAACAGLAEQHRDTVMAARTLLQQAVPTTFGCKAAGWLVAVLAARDRLARAELPAQLGGAAGTLAAFGDRGLEVAALYAEELGLSDPGLPWHTNRLPVAELGSALAAAAGVAAKIGTDVMLLAQTEVAEVSEGDGGGSSTMPHKANPTAAVLAIACERHARAAASVLAESVVAQHERAAGAWHAEWHALTTALAAAGGAVAAARRSLESLRVDAERMRANLSAETLSEAERFGGAQRPEDYLGSAGTLVDRALARYRG